MSDSTIIFDIDAGFATITLNRPTRHNALTLEMLARIDRAVAQIEEAKTLASC